MSNRKKHAKKKVNRKKRTKQTNKHSILLWSIPAFTVFAGTISYALLDKDIEFKLENLPLFSRSFSESDGEIYQILTSSQECLTLDQELTPIHEEVSESKVVSEEFQETIALTEKSSISYNNLVAFNDEYSDATRFIAQASRYSVPDNSFVVSDPIQSPDSRLEIGGDYTYLTLKPASHESFSGSLGGAQASYEYRPVNRFYGAATFDWKEGTTTNSSSSRSILYFDVQEKLGYTFAPSNRDLFVSLFSGFGYRYSGQTLDQDGVSDLRFGYNQFYFPVGFVSSFGINSWFSLGVDFSWMPQVFSTVSIKPLKGARWNLNNILSNMYVEIPFVFTFTQKKSFQLLIKPFYQYWRDGHSSAKLSSGIPLGLPGNTYNFYGVNVDFGYCF